MQTVKWTSRSRRFFAVGASVAAIALGAVGARAQTGADPASAQDGATSGSATEAGDIVVTASRAGVSAAQAPTPTTVVGAGAIEQRQATNIAQILNEVPAFRATTSPAANAIRTQTPGASTADLRGLGAARTLVLVNGARIPPLAPASNGTGTIPTAPISIPFPRFSFSASRS